MSTHSYGIESLWQQSDIVIKTVACILLLMSICTWLIIMVRSVQWFTLQRLGKQAVLFWNSRGYNEGLQLLDNKDHSSPFYQLALEAKNAVDHHTQHQHDLNQLLPLTEWLVICLRNAIDEFSEKLQPGMGILASVGSTSPFIGLFGTVWGIYHALISISTAGHVNISEVAGPVGESLIMTAFGLIVAIPAVLGYNAINRGNKNILNKLNRFAHQLHAYFITGATPAKSNHFQLTTSKPQQKAE